MLFLGALWLSLVAVCLSEDVWDPTDPRCEEKRKDPGYQITDVMQAYELITKFQTYHLNYKTHMWYMQYYKSMKDGIPTIQRGCDNYESVKKTWPYRCWTQDFFCVTAKVVQLTIDGFEEKNGIIKKESSFVDHLELAELLNEVDWVVMIRWNDPKLMDYDKKNLDEVGGKMFDRILSLIEHNDYYHLKDFFDRFSSSGAKTFLEDQCKGKNQNDNDMQCKIGIVFDRIDKLLEDPIWKARVVWCYEGGRMHACPPKIKGDIYFLYLLKPDVYEIMFGSDKDRNSALCHRLETIFTSFFNDVLNKDGKKMKDYFAKFDSVCALMKQECANDFEHMDCYLSETCDRMEELKTLLGADYSNWESPKAQNKRAIVLVWLLLTPKECFNVITTDIKKAKVIKELLKIMYTKLRGNDLTGLQEIANRIPRRDQMRLTISDDCAPNFDQINREIKCGLKIILENLAIFLGQYNSREKNTKRLNLAVNYKQRLEQFQISSIRGAVENTKLELKSSLEEFAGELKKFFENSLGNRFENLKQYYQTLASFDLEIANADTAFINGKLDEFQRTAAKLNEKLEYDGEELQEDVVLIKSIDAAFMWMKAAGSGISAVLGAITGDFDGFTDAADRVDAAAKATLEAVKGDAIGGQIEITSKKFDIIAAGLKDNQNQLENTRRLIDNLNSKDTDSEEFKRIQSDFIKAYNDYTPKVSAAQIAELDTAWSEVVDNLEGVMDSMESKEGIAGATKSFANNHFFKIKLVVPQLTQTLSDRFDFQFEMMDSLAAAVRAHTSRQGAEALSQGLPDLDRHLEESVAAQIALDQMALSTYILSQFHLLLILSQYCNYITYVNAGIESFKCTEALNTMDPVHIDDALSFSPPSCDPVSVNLKIPTSLSGRTDSINLNQLNSGESVPFQIPNFEWLMTNGEISALDKDSALFVKLFEVYAITNDNYQIRNNLRVTVTPTGSAPIYPTAGQVKYELLPSSRTSYVFEYKENYEGRCRSEENPYFVCKPGPEGICVQSRGELTNELGAYPSIYSPWTIQLDKNIGNAPNPAKGTIFYLQAKLQLCRKAKDVKSLSVRKRSLRERLEKCKARIEKYKDNLSKFKTKLSEYKDKLSEYKAKLSKFKGNNKCPEGKYYDQVSGKFVACSDGSAPAHNNYYCEMNSN